MEKNTEGQILSELKNINRSLQDMNNKLDSVGKPRLIIWDIIKSLLIGFLIAGPAIAVAIIIFQVITSWLFN